MALTDSFPGASGTADSTEIRKGLAGLIVRDVNGVARPGVFFQNGNPIVTARSDMKVDVAAFNGASVRGGGPLFQQNDGTVQVTLSAAPSSNSRYDVVYFKQNEAESPYSDSNNLPVLAVQQGAAAPSPSLATVLAALPAGAVPLSSALVPFSATATNSSGVVITQLFQFTAAAGGKVPFRTLADLKLWTTSAVGQDAYVFADGTPGNNGSYLWSGVQWIGGAATQSLAPAAGGLWTNSAQGEQARVTKRNGRVFMDGAFANAQGVGVAAGSDYTVLTMDSSFAPPVASGAVRFGTVSINALSVIRVNTDGTVTFSPTFGGTYGTGVLWTALDGMNWNAR